jgi:hypothetical protein
MVRERTLPSYNMDAKLKFIRHNTPYSSSLALKFYSILVLAENLIKLSHSLHTAESFMTS